MAIKARDCIGGDIVGVDIMPTLDGRDVLLEINAVPGWKGTQQAIGVDLTEKVLQYIQKKKV